VDLSKASSLDDVAYLWSKFLISELIGRRERQEAAIAPYLFTFEKREGRPLLPITPSAALGTPPQVAEALKVMLPETFAYLVVVPGSPMASSTWETSDATMPSQEQAQIPLGIPEELIDRSRPHIWWFSAVFVSNTKQATFCAGFDGDTFTDIREVEGTYGGSFSSLGGLGAPEA